MKTSLILEKVRKYIQRQHSRVLAFVVLFVSLGVILWWLLGTYSYDTYVSEPLTDTTPLAENLTESDTITASSSQPLTLRIPSLNLTAEFEPPLGLDALGAVEVPEAYNTVGWYKYGPTPGELGPTVILGHVDTYEGPAIFYSLGQVQEGDLVYIDRTDGSTVTFEISGFERVKQDEFPTDRVYGNIPYAGIRLITCTGVYNKGVQRYSHNLIVYGKLVSIEHPPTNTATSTE